MHSTTICCLKGPSQADFYSGDDHDFAVATHARGIDGWMSFYAPDAIRIRYRGNMVKGAKEIRWLVIMDTGYPETAVAR